MKTTALLGFVVLLLVGAFYSPILTKQEKLELRAALSVGPGSVVGWAREIVAVRMPGSDAPRNVARRRAEATDDALVREAAGGSTFAVGALRISTDGADEGPVTTHPR
ncbi:MAG: hypothetical protein EXR68_07170 [Dehalococcoidia bacterium]|nr:hypothetical protein [Dehalococcoidia bacterium]